MCKGIHGLILIGGSAGSKTIIQGLLNRLPNSFKLPIVIVRHLSQDLNRSSYTMELARYYNFSMREPNDKETMSPSTVYVAPPGYHLLLEDHHFALSTEERLHFCRPSIDRLFFSAAKLQNIKIWAVLLSGANEDGAEGIKAIERSGGNTFVQDPLTAEFPRMPQAALDLEVQASILPPEELIESILSIITPSKGKDYVE